ncbi:TetR family transcriptional regulator [Agrobacterium radiobacter]|uniref:TetR family transcriptional regulator n=1 Tax=Agrobacterium radiobacter TaxID=362 RepID=A0ABD5LMS0_AGRRD
MIDAAEAIFAGAGFDVPLEAIAKSAGVSRMTFYRHFQQRESLCFANIEPNNSVEKTIRPIALNRKNLVFCNFDRGRHLRATWHQSIGYAAEQVIRPSWRRDCNSQITQAGYMIAHRIVYCWLNYIE